MSFKKAFYKGIKSGSMTIRQEVAAENKKAKAMRKARLARLRASAARAKTDAIKEKYSSKIAVQRERTDAVVAKARAQVRVAEARRDAYKAKMRFGRI